MDMDDDRPRTRAAAPVDLSRLGIRELEEYIAGLEAEIARARAFIDSKRALRGDADSLFKPRGNAD